MSLRALRTLQLIAHKGSFVAAAEQLGLTQAAVSLQIKNLEETLGTTLFNREGHKPKLNANGRLVVERAEQIVRLFDSLKADLAPEGKIRGELRLGAVHTVITGPLPAVLARLKHNHEELRIKLTCNLSAELARRVQEEELDGALVTEPIHVVPPSCQWTEYDTEKFYVAAPTTVDRTDYEKLFERYPYVRFDRTSWAGAIIEAHLVERGIEPREVMEFDTCEAALSLVAKGLGITVVPVSDKRLADVGRDFTLIPFGRPQVKRRIGLYQRRRHSRQALLSLVLDEMKRETSPLSII
jgi:DNA-binding transcriptional LysR family regulator